MIVSLDTSTRAMVYDPKLGLGELALLVYLLKRNPEKPFAVREAWERFGKSRTWWHRTFSKLQDAGYAAHQKLSTSKGEYNHTYIVTDNPEVLEQSVYGKSLTATTLHQRNMDQGAPVQHGEPVEFSNPQEVEGPFHDVDQDALVQHVRKNKKDKIIYTPAPARTSMLAEKAHDPLSTTKEQRQLAQFYYDKQFPIIRQENQWAIASNEQLQMWAEVTEQPLSWNTGRYVNNTLKEYPLEPNKLEKVWMEWTALGFKPTNVSGILSWYIILTKDDQATPWNYKRGSNDNRNNARSKPSQEHGTVAATDQASSTSTTYTKAAQPAWWNESANGKWNGNNSP